MIEILQLLLPHFIDESWEWFGESIDHLYDKTGCNKAKVAPIMENDTYQPFGRCKRSDKKCEIDRFFLKTRKSLERYYVN